MDKDTYARIKRAYQITINGCGGDCLECERKVCLCDTKQIKQDAKRWMKQKACERKFYKENRDKRLQASKDYYNQWHKVENPMACRRLKIDLLLELPDSFDYATAGRAWLLERGCVYERVNLFIRRGFLTKQNKNGKVRCFKTEFYYKKLLSESKHDETTIANENDKNGA